MRRLMKTAVTLVAALALAMTVTVGSELPATAAGSCKITLSRYKTVKAGSHGSSAKAAQCLLRSAGYRISTDGSFSKADAADARAFKRSHQIGRSGTVTQATWTALLSRGSKATIQVGDRNSSVKRLQRSLTASGRKVPVTGYFGPITKGAVKSVQRHQGWKATGKASASVWRALQAGGDKQVKGPKKSKSSHKAPKPSKSSGSKGARALAFAKRQIGDSYRYGATGPNSWDCSGLTGGAWKSVGVKIPRTSQQQYRSGKKVSKSNLKPGDLVFFYSGISHVGIYAGHGNVVHASRPGKPVETIKMAYMPFAGARRPA